MSSDWQKDQGAKCSCRGHDEYCGCQNINEAERKPPFVMDEDWLTDVLGDSVDMDWTARTGARAIMRAIERERTM